MRPFVVHTADVPAGKRLSEFELIAQIEKLAASAGEKIVRSIGDDAAIIHPAADCDLVWAIDAQVEDIHFRRGWAAPAEIGWRALAINLSDLAAMGARPLGVLSSIAMPESWSDADVVAMHKGIVRCGKEYGCPLIGGNISASVGAGLQLHVSILGETGRSKALRRDHAEEGDDIWATGELGGAALALAALEDENKGASAQLLRRYLRPRPPLEFARHLPGLGVRAAIDVSDGLCADLGHVLKASGNLGARVDLARVPVPRELAAVRRAGAWEEFAAALNGGEDYQLLFCAKPEAKTREAIEKLAGTHGARVKRIGEVVKAPGIVLLTTDGDVLRYDGPRGWQHRR